MIRAENLYKRFGSTVAVNGASFVAGDGSVTGLLGPNGAGKTTSLRMLYGLMRPDSGSIAIDHCDVVADPQSAQSLLGVLPDQSGLYGRLTTREHIRYFGNLHGLGGAELERGIDHWIKVLDIAPLAERRVAGFSHGEQMKVALARALIHNPQNVILDEPTNGLDVMSTRTVRDVIRKLKAEGRCVLFSSHIMQEVSALCDRIVVIAAGRVVATSTPDDLLTTTGKSTLEDAFVSLVGTNGEAA
jgi:sodium transport system ATP-binding protein